MEQNNQDNRPLSPWAYWGLSLLYAIPVIGLIFVIIFSFGSSNINRRNFTRSYWCWILLVLILVLALAVSGELDYLLYKLDYLSYLLF